MLLIDLKERGLIRPPEWLPANCGYLTYMGSVAYGVSSDTSDADVYGWAFAPKEITFPWLAGEIPGFGRQVKRFEQWQEHHILDIDALGGKGRVWDFQVFNIVKYFQLVMEGNPNMIDSLFTPTNCVIHMTQVGNLIRENRRLFLSKKCWHTFKSYSYAQINGLNRKPVGKRKETVEKYGYDLKFAYHIVRLLNEVEMLLTEGDLDLQRNNEQLKSIRRGEWKEEEVREYFTKKERELETAYTNSKLPHSPDEEAIKQLLLKCLEQHYGSLDKVIHNPGKYENAIHHIRKILSDLGG